jgi:hypothetical protein
MQNLTTSIHWTEASLKLPDDDLTVLIAEADGEVSEGFHESGVWRYANAAQVLSRVTHWAEWPEAPSNVQAKP